MSRMPGLALRRFTALAVALVALGLVCALPAFSQPPGACGVASTATVAAVDESVARQIYRGELGSTEVYADQAHVQDAQDLLTAVANDDITATASAVKRLVFTPRWHIVRLRVRAADGALLADVGGPHVMAPVSGQLKLNGTVVGSYEMSVQDDVGYQKLVTRFIAVPIELYRAGQPLLGTMADPPRHPPATASRFTIGAATYRAVSYAVKAFPAGTLRVVLAIGGTAASVASSSCAEVRAGAYGAVFVNIAARFPHLSSEYNSYVRTTKSLDREQVFVRDGSVQLAGTLSPGPAHIPDSGRITFEGQRWLVFSFAPEPPARIYFLLPAAE
jgi:hypothetical protein